MGNQCPSNCQFSCCDYFYNCTSNSNNCYYFYYDWSWVYWVCGVCILLFFIFSIIGLRMRQRRRLINRLVVDTSNASYTMTVPQNSYRTNTAYNQGYANGNINYAGGQQYNQGYNYGYQNYNHPQEQGGFEMGQPVFLSDNNQNNQIYR